MSYNDLSIFKPGETQYGNDPNRFREALRAEATGKASYLSQMDMFYKQLEEQKREFEITTAERARMFDEELGFKERSFDETLAWEQEKFGKSLELERKKLTQDDWFRREQIRVQEKQIDTNKALTQQQINLEKSESEQMVNLFKEQWTFQKDMDTKKFEAENPSLGPQNASERHRAKFAALTGRWI